MNHPSPRYAPWKAPDEDGRLLLWPDAVSLLWQTRDNHQRLSTAATALQNIPLAELRTAQRGALGHSNDDQLLIATGHQTELYHPGVWVKDALAHALARRLDGRAWHFAVDSDAPKHLHLRWPGGSVPITQDPRITSAAWCGLLAAAARAHIDQIQSAFAQAKAEWDFDPMTAPFFDTLKGSAHSTLAPQLAQAIGRLNESLGLRTTPALMSPLWMAEPFLVFAHHLLARAGRFAASYNVALAAYRREQGVTSPGRPMPDLDIKPDEAETAFWIDDLQSQSRGRLVVRRTGGRWFLPAPARAPQAGRPGPSADMFELDEHAPGWEAAARFGSFLQAHQLRLAPRALPLTLFFRVCMADQYIHGIGGGRYDQVSDRIIADFFGLEPPRFSVTTATLYFPAAQGQQRIDPGPLLREGRRLRHGSLRREKRDLADRIAALPRGSQERRRLFFEMHAELERQASSDAMREWSQRLNNAAESQLRQKALFDRELFFAIQPRERLRGMISRYDAALA